jgi:hypothetical protein
VLHPAAIVLVAEANVPALWTRGTPYQRFLLMASIRAVSHRDWWHRTTPGVAFGENKTSIFACAERFPQVSGPGMPLQNHNDPLVVKFRQLACELAIVSPPQRQSAAQYSICFHLSRPNK